MYACMLIAELHVKLKWQDLLPNAQIKQLGEWMSEAVHPTGLGLGWLLNDIYNDDKFLAAKIVSTAIPVAVAQIASSANSTTAYTISEMIDRMALACSKEWKESVRLVLDRNQIIQTVAQWPNGENLASLSKYCLALSLYDTEFAFEVLQSIMPILQQALAANPITTFHEIEDIAWHLLRVWDPLGIYIGKLAPDHRQIDLARALCKLIDYKKTAERISASPKRDLQRAAFFLGFFHRVAPQKAAVLCRKLDWSRLGMTIGTEWNCLTHDTTIFICQAALSEQSRGIVVSAIKEHLTDIKIMPSRIAVLTPELACAVVDQGGVIALDEDMALSWKIPAYIIHKFGELRPELVPILIAPHETKAAMSLQSKQINIYDNADIFIHKLNEFSPDSLSRILARIDPVAAETAWAACLAKGGKAGRTSAYLVEHCLTLPNELGQVAKRLRQRFPKASISK